MLIITIGFFLSTPLTAADSPRAIEEIKSVLDQQVRDWNAGDIRKFMDGYLQSEQTRFASGGDVTLGWNSVLERYQKTYADRSAMGTLSFSEVDVTAAGPDNALVFGRWKLTRAKDEPSGLFTLFFRKTPMGWRIVHDHTSAAEKK
jgi:ketosteroid isomerase-like protein